MTDCVIDNDVVLKCVCYGFFDALVVGLPNGPHVPGLLGTARFVLPRLLRRRQPRRFEQAQLELSGLLTRLESLEPSDTETKLAAKLEYEAQRQAIPADVGECQLVAILVSRGYRWLLSGDKRALAGLAAMTLPTEIPREALVGKLMCFEQAVLCLVAAKGGKWVRNAICNERDVDTSMRICFSCTSPEVGEESWNEGLSSEVKNLRVTCGDLLKP